ncbi:hypothetical protein WN55_03739 [Dufourea novaeangliae]|uniref:Uncharacterized protein n=1 Tax=Dufourea novaeangliae TaxID=178035 RepID=A0A154PK57_DUFNO|nr:hypothetical protein WN55_03739 [Dufourea novaeangliae]
MKTLNNLVAGCKSRREATFDWKCHKPSGTAFYDVTRRGDVAADNILAGCQFLGAYRTINWERDVYYLIPSSLAILPPKMYLFHASSIVRNVCSSSTVRYFLDLHFPMNRVRHNFIRIIRRSVGGILDITQKNEHEVKCERSNFSGLLCPVHRSASKPIKEDNKSFEKDMSKHDSGTVPRPIIHWLKPDSKQLMRSAYRRVRGDHSRWTGIIIRQRLPIGETSAAAWHSSHRWSFDMVTEPGVQTEREFVRGSG